MKTPVKKQTITAVHDLEIGQFTFYQNIIICDFKEGVHVNLESLSFLIQLAQIAFGTETPVIYITHRRNSYSWDSINYRETLKLFPNIIALAIVAEDKRRHALAKLDSQFVKNSISVFNNMKDCFAWSEKILSKLN